MNAVIYARYSSHGQSEQSIEGQLAECYTFAKREGYIVVGEYIDRHISGRTDERPDFQRMLHDAGKKQFEYVLVWKLDRFARNRYDSAMNKARLKKHGVRVISATENITDSPEGIILEGLLESMAEYYSANLSQNVKRGQRRSIEKGNHLGGNVPYGYRIDNKKLVIDEAKAPIVKYTFEQYAKGVPKQKIVEDLNARGVRDTNGKPLTVKWMQGGLKNPKYKGVYIYNGQEVKDCCEAIIDADTFDKVQARLIANKKASGGPLSKVEYLLQGKLFCGHCKTKMVGESGRGKQGNNYYYYSCGKRKRTHDCDKKNEKKGFIEWYVVEQTAEYMLDKNRIDTIAAGVVAEYKKEFGNSRIAELQKQYDSIDKQINRLVDAVADTPKTARARFMEKIENLETQRLDIEIDISKLRIAKNIKVTEKQVVAMLKDLCSGDPLNVAYQKRIIDMLIHSIYLYDNKVVILYNVIGGKQTCIIDPLDADELPDDFDDLMNKYGVRMVEASDRHKTPSASSFPLADIFFLRQNHQ